MFDQRNNSSPSVWVTAYCCRVFSEASFNEWENFLFIDPNVIAKGISWLLQYQTEEGSFYEVSPYANRKLNDTIISNGYAYSPNITLTAHVLIALHNVKDLPGVIGPRLAVARQKAVNYLEIKIDSMRYGSRPYEIAVVTYALMLNKSPKADSAFIILSEHAQFEGGLAYWGREKVPVPDFKLENNKPFLLPRLPHKYDSENIEATAYALLVYVARQELVFVEPIVKWLNTQRLYDGGWASTQDTATAMRALIDYTIRSNIRNVTDLSVTIEAVSVPDRVTTFRINSDHLATPQKLHINPAYGTVKVQAKGAGYAILQMQVQYGVDRARFVTDPPVKAFSLQTYGKFHGRNASYIEYTSCQSWTYLEESERSGMAVLEVKIPTGYFILQTRLDEYVLSGLVPTLRRAKYFHDKVVIYFDYLEINPTCVNFTLERWFPVANMTRYLPVRVYDYYAPERFNETIFEAFDVFILDICQVCGSYMCPYCPIFASSCIFNPSISVILTSTTFIYLFSCFLFSPN
ncbi:Complement C3 [Folsomia candida]|uniref:Complement C3 n=1 Tax=Folsomia candida TaxID=158441 RepID=A0A226EZT6_FOLCA|nr:Complement C3 [Folsomia candida]